MSAPAARRCTFIGKPAACGTEPLARRGAASSVAMQQPTAAAACSAGAGRVGQSVDDFYRAAERRAAVAFADSRRCRASSWSHCSALRASTGSIRTNTMSPRFSRRWRRRALGQAQGCRARRRMLSEAFVAYVDDLKRDPGRRHHSMSIAAAEADAAIAARGAARGCRMRRRSATMSAHMGWMHPFTASFAQALAEHQYATTTSASCSRSTCSARGRCRPASSATSSSMRRSSGCTCTRTASRSNSMVVVVGKPKYPTPMMTAYIRFAALNPIGTCRPTSPAERVAPERGQARPEISRRLWLRGACPTGPATPTIIDPKTIDWKAVADGKVEVMIRQKPGPAQFDGPDQVHVPQRVRRLSPRQSASGSCSRRLSRYYSGGCVRLEDAWRLGRWLFGRDLTWEGAGTEEPVPLTAPVPVYITYLTAMPRGRHVDRLFRRRLRARHGEAGGDRQQQRRRRSQAASALEAPPPVREEGDVLRDRTAGGVERRAEADVAQRQLAHQAVDRPDRRSSARRGSWTRCRRGLTRMVTPTTPLGIPVDASRRYSRVGNLA